MCFALSCAYKLSSGTAFSSTVFFLYMLGSTEFDVCFNNYVDLICCTSVISFSVNLNFVIRVLSQNYSRDTFCMPYISLRSAMVSSDLFLVTVA